MAEPQETELIPKAFLSFALTALEFVAIFIALYSYLLGDMELATVFLGIAGVLLVCLGIYHIFDRDNLARLIMTGALTAGYVYLLTRTEGGSALLWCLISAPVIVGCYGYRFALYPLSALLFIALWVMSGFALPFDSATYTPIESVRFLSAFAIISAFSIAADLTRFRSLEKYRDLSLRVDQIAHQDQLTQLPNRHDMERRLENKYQQYRLVNTTFSILLADIDNFKFINDRYGHDVGDDVLHAASMLLAEPLRGEDVVARWGGNQFMVLLPTAPSEAAVDVAERLRKRVSELEMEALGDKLRVSLSIGIASIDKCTSIDDLISTAENGLYQAKHMGRDMVIVG